MSAGRPARPILALLLLALATGRPLSAEDPAASAIVTEAMRLPTAWSRLRVLTDTVGARLAGSEAEPLAVEWARREFGKDGIAVRLEPVMVPVWVRGDESASMVKPRRQPLALLGLGGTVGTRPGGITAPVVVVGSDEELKALGQAKVAGKIVLYDNPWVRTGEEFADYGRAVKYRGRGASDAAKLGAVAALIRAVGTATLRTPHTGALHYENDAPKIPAAAISMEDASLIRRLTESGEEVVVSLKLGAKTLPDRPGSNVVAEIRGRELPDEIVLVGAHLDSWDVGTGAIDDGAGCAMVLETMRLIAARAAPRRTVRAVLFANEENGLRGGKGYAEAHKAEADRHVAALEADAGAGRALGVSVTAGEGGLALVQERLAPILAPIGAARFREGGGGADIGPLKEMGVPVLSLNQESSRYFDWHHTQADTLDKVEPGDLQQAAAALAATVWSLAEMPERLALVPPEKRTTRR